MRHSFVHISWTLLFSFVLAGPALSQSQVATNPGLAPPGRYSVVRDHTQVVFSILHLGLSPYFGRVAGATGTMTFNPLDPSRSNLSIELDPKSVSTLSDLVSRQLCGDDVFACAKFPKITFKSTSIKRTGDTSGDV